MGWTYTQPGNWKTLRKKVLTRDGQRCYLCGAHATQVDHVVNVAAGGSHDPDNLAAICEGCHRIKSSTEQRKATTKRPARTPETHPGAL